MDLARRLTLAHLLLAAAALAMAAPAHANRDLMLVLDDSGSMRQNDPERRSVRAFAEFVLDQRSEDRVGLVLFSDSARLAAPLTHVTPAETPGLLASISDVTFGGARTDLAVAVERALYELRFDGRPGAEKAIVLLTDGVLDTGSQASDLEKAHWLRTALAQEASSEGVRIFSIAFTEAADFQLLHSVAETTGGDYFRATASGEFSRILERVDQRIGDRVDTSQETVADVQTPAADMATDGATDGATERATAESRADQRTDASASSQATDAGEQATADTAETADLQPAPAPVTDPSAVDAYANLLRNWRVWAAAGILLGGLAAWLFMRRRSGRTLLPAALIRMLRREKKATRAVLYDMSDEADVKRYELSDNVTIIGRVAGQEPGRQYIVVRERTVGRRHATLERRGEIYWIRDENSVNGTYINGKRIRGEQPLKHGDSVVVHKHKFLFVVPELIGSDKTLMEHDDLVRQAVKG